MADEELDGVLLTRPGAVSWVTAGAENPIVRGSDGGAFCWALVTRDGAFVITQNIEGPRLEQEGGLGTLGFEVLQHPWYSADLWLETVHRTAGEAIGADTGTAGRNLAAEVIRMRLPLLASERERLRVLGMDAVSAVETAYLGSAGGTPSGRSRRLSPRSASCEGLSRRCCWSVRMSGCGDSVTALQATRRFIGRRWS